MPRRPRYHHGDLRRQLVAAGVELVAERGVDGFSMRELARRAGVSHAAPYHHFPTRAALVRAVVADSYALLANALRHATSGADDPLDAIRAMGVAYVDFALTNPERYRLMFRSELTGPPENADLTADELGTDAFAVLIGAFELAHERGRLADETTAASAAIAAWASVHGVASLILEGALGIPAFQRERALGLAAAVVELGVSGFGRRP